MEQSMEKEILDLLGHGPLTLANLRRKLKGKFSDVQLQRELGCLIQKNKVLRIGMDYYRRDDRFVEGYAHFDRGNGYSIQADNGDRYFVPLDLGMGAMDGDRVIIRNDAQNRGPGLGPSSVVEILSRSPRRLIAVCKNTGKSGLSFQPDRPMPFDLEVTVDPEQKGKMTAGTKVCLRIDSYPSVAPAPKGMRPVRGKVRASVSRILGQEGDRGLEVLVRLYANGIEPEFSEDALFQAKQIPGYLTQADRAGRRDLRGLKTLTIDGEDTRDFDDALSIVPQENGWKLYVHIADVSHYVKEGSAMDREACTRGTSVYAAGLVVPMLPAQISEDVCSLVPGEDRLAVTCEMDVAPDGRVMNAEVYESVICSDVRCCYSVLNRALSGDEQALEESREVMETVEELADLASVLKNLAHERGCLEFASSEPRYVFDGDEYPCGMYVPERGPAQEIVEQIMVLTNTEVAKMFKEKNLPCLYRVHRGPDGSKKEQLNTFLQAMHLKRDLDLERAEPLHFQRLLESVANESVRDMVNRFILRSMTNAVYSEKCEGHYGLSLDAYTHFTSPIRRYPDLMVHRLLKKLIIRQTPVNTESENKMLRERAVYLSERERVSSAAQREVNALASAAYAEQHLGECFEGYVAGAGPSGLYVHAENGMNGMVRVESLPGTYLHDARAQCLICLDNEQRFSIGQKVTLTLNDADKKSGKIFFTLEERAQS